MAPVESTHLRVKEKNGPVPNAVVGARVQNECPSIKDALLALDAVPHDATAPEKISELSDPVLNPVIFPAPSVL
jgi:hypothetical protein